MNREKVLIGGYEMWLDRRRSILFDKEHCKYGTIFDVMGSYPHIHITSIMLTDEEKKELIGYLKGENKNELV